MRAAFSTNASDRMKFIDREVHLFKYVQCVCFMRRYRLKHLGKDDELLDMFGIKVDIVPYKSIKILFPEYIQKQNANGRSKETDFFSVPFEKALPFVSVSIIRSSDSCLLVTFC